MFINRQKFKTVNVTKQQNFSFTCEDCIQGEKFSLDCLFQLCSVKVNLRLNPPTVNHLIVFIALLRVHWTRSQTLQKLEFSFVWLAPQVSHCSKFSFNELAKQIFQPISDMANRG